jgi:hypothetical protein
MLYRVSRCIVVRPSVRGIGGRMQGVILSSGIALYRMYRYRGYDDDGQTEKGHTKCERSRPNWNLLYVASRGETRPTTYYRVPGTGTGSLAYW